MSKAAEQFVDAILNGQSPNLIRGMAQRLIEKENSQSNQPASRRMDNA
jgi:hypothetical protein